MTWLQKSKRKTCLAAATCVLLFTPDASAACSHGLAERALAEYEAQQPQREAARRLAKRQQSPPTNLAQQEGLTDPVAECTPYYWSGSEAYQGQFPPIWQIATIVPGDTEATNAYNAIVNAPGFPNLPPKGTPQGDFSGVQYDNSDPDCWWTWSRCVKPKAQGLPADVSTCPEPETWGLSYDDGPNCTHNAFYDYLKEQDHTATMFYIGSNVLNWPLQAQRGLADLHEIGIHTWSHRYSTALTNEQMFAELWYSRKAIKAVIGITPTTWRAPYGDVDDRIRAIAHGLGLTTVLWDHDTFDWQVQGPGNPNGLATTVVEQNYDALYGLQAQGAFSGHGAIVLSHEINQGTMDIAMQELPAIAGNFKHIVPVSTCQNNSQPYEETTYSFPTFQQYLATNSSKMVNGSVSTTSAVSTITSTTTRSSSTSAGAGATSASSRLSGNSTSGIHAAGAGVSSTTHHSSAQRTVRTALVVITLVAAIPAVRLSLV